ncbi:MAG: MBL fold metallo-hydrolase [Thaumarchaeota archaeon]|nr:MBL fold metallo-hydrolase [Nitrososphaerota archaeon]
MPPKLTCYGGVGEIGGNKFLLQDRDTQVLLDFGTGFSDGSAYFDSVIKPRGVNGAGDLFEFGLLPEIEGLYSEDALQNTVLKHSDPKVDAVVLSHYHWDHMGRVEYVDPEIPVYCGQTASLLHQANSETGGSPLDDHKLKTFRTGDRFRIGSIEFVPVHVDHSIPGAYGFIVHMTEGTLAYTGDFRFHGGAGSMTEDFIDAAHHSSPDLLLTEGTRVSAEDRRGNTTESSVLKEAIQMVKASKKLVLSTFRGNDIDRVNTFYKAASAAGRQLVVSMKTAALLEKLKDDGGISVPRVGKDVLVYVRRKRSGTLDDKDYRQWERRFLDHGVSASDIKKREGETFLHLDAWNFPEVIDIKPESGGTYIHAATEAYNEEGEEEAVLIRNWTDHLGFSYHQLHASGHAPMPDVGRMVRGVSPKKVVPIHTEHPELFMGFRGFGKWRLEVPSISKPIGL